MPPPPPPKTLQTLLTTTTTFLTILTHELLYLRNLYPRPSFLLTKAYNTPVHQNRHPRVCQWITDAVAAVREQLLHGSVARICIVVYDERDRPLERVVLDVGRFPVVDRRDGEREILRAAAASGSRAKDATTALPDWNPEADVDLQEQFRATLLRLSTSCARLAPLPPNCTFGMAIELKEERNAQPPVAHPQPWIPVQPSEQASRNGGPRGEDLGGVRTTPVRSVESGECVFEVWIEEAAGKLEGMGE